MWHSRQSIADFVLRHEPRIRELARKKLSPQVRSAFGSDDVFSTIVRRLDALAAAGQVRAESEAQLWALIRSIAENVVLQRLRLIESTSCRSGEDAAFWSMVSADLRRTSDDTEAFVLVFRMLASLTDKEERHIFSLRLRGVSHKVIAQQLGCSPEAVRQRWSKIMDSLRKRDWEAQDDVN